MILLSSVKAMTDTTPAAGIDETFGCNPQTPYGKSKLAGERLCEGELDGQRLTILRPTPVYGNGSKGNLDKLVRLTSMPWFPYLPRTSGRRSMVHVDDLARLVAELVSKPVPGTFIVDDGRTYSPRQVQEFVRHSTNNRRKIIVPSSAIRTIGALGTALERVSGFHGFTRVDVSRILDHAVYSGRRVRRLTGWEPYWSLDAALSAAL